MTEVIFRSDVDVQLIEQWGSDHRTVQAARVSTQGADSLQSGESLGLTKFLYREKHSVPFEHSGATFLIDAPIFVMRQILKHRITSISEWSGRYSVLKPEFYWPDIDRPVKQVGKTGEYRFERDHELSVLVRKEIADVSRYTWESYEHMLESGVSKEVARMILPVNTFSSMYLTANNRSLFNFFKLRSDREFAHGHPQHEIALVANKMYELWKEKFPQTAEVFELYETKGE